MWCNIYLIKFILVTWKKLLKSELTWLTYCFMYMWLSLCFMCIFCSFLKKSSALSEYLWNESVERVYSTVYLHTCNSLRFIDKKKKERRAKTSFFTHCSKSSFFVQKFNVDFLRELSIFWGWKTRENVVGLDFLAVDNFDFTRKIVKKNWMKNSW